jgi:hypothetical protein
MSSRYLPLTQYLNRAEEKVIRLTFDEIERILGRALPSSARSHRAWWSNSGHAQARAWTTAGFVVRQPELQNGIVQFVKKRDPSGSRDAQRPTIEEEGQRGKAPWRAWHGVRSKWQIEHHLASLDERFEHYLQVFDHRRIFSGPSLYFYERTVAQRREASSADALVNCRSFHELVYASLTAWGMHRMGESVAAKLTEFNVFRESLRKLIEGTADLWRTTIIEIGEEEIGSVAEKLAALVGLEGITASGAPLVANSKTLHFILPDLVPPMDRTYTGRFFFGPTKGLLLPGSPQKNFLYMFSALHLLARRHADTLNAAAGKAYLCMGHAKALDNAIVGYVLSHSRLFPKPGGRHRVS